MPHLNRKISPEESSKLNNFLDRSLRKKINNENRNHFKMPSIHSTLKEQGSKRISGNETGNSFISHDE